MDNYHIYDQISRKKDVTTYKARQKQTIQYVTAKSYAKKLLGSVRNAVQLTNNLVHPNIVRFHNWYETRNHIWVVEEFCIGGTLRALRSQDRYVPESAVRRFGVDIVAGLRFLHGNGILHCNLRPTDILIDEYGVMKITGFGLAQSVLENSGKRKDKAAKSTSETEKRAARKVRKANTYYMAPELLTREALRSEKKISYSRAVDTYAFGLILWEALCLARAWGQFNFSTQVIDRVMEGIRPDVPKAYASPLLRPPPGYTALMNVCWHQNAAHRPKFDRIIEGLKALRPCSADIQGRRSAPKRRTPKNNLTLSDVHEGVGAESSKAHEDEIEMIEML